MDNSRAHNESLSERYLKSGRVGVFIPTYNAAGNWYALQAGLDVQGVPPSQVVVIDSSSDDGTRSLAERAGYRVVSIPKKISTMVPRAKRLPSSFLMQKF